MSAHPTLCSECEYLHASAKHQPSHLWMCSQHKRLPGYTGFVTGELWEKDPPFLFCRQVNAGACPLWKRRRDGQMELADE